MKPRYQKKKNAGCAPWILAGVRAVFERATQKPEEIISPTTLCIGINKPKKENDNADTISD